jgi:hypothetical protein
MAEGERALLPVCPNGCARGWVLAQESPEQVRCSNPACPYWQGQAPLATDPRIHFDRVIASVGDTTARLPVLKMSLRWTRATRAGES